MSINLDVFERGFRIALGASLLSFAFLGTQTAWGVVGVIPMLTGILGFCPLYRLAGYSSCPLEPSRSA